MQQKRLLKKKIKIQHHPQYEQVMKRGELKKPLILSSKLTNYHYYYNFLHQDN